MHAHAIPCVIVVNLIAGVCGAVEEDFKRKVEQAKKNQVILLESRIILFQLYSPSKY